MHRVVVVVVVAMLAGCIEPAAEVTCGDLICPSTSVCLANGTCATHDDAAACDGLNDGATCQTPVFAGTCRGGACFAPVCGNGVVEGTEQCDGSVGSIDCVDFGFDLGSPTCSSCVLDVTDSCVRFGWQPVLSEPAQTAWTDGTRFGVIREDQTGADFYNTRAQIAGSVERTNTFYIAGSAKSIVVGTPLTVDRWDGPAVTAIDVTALGLVPNNVAIEQIQVADDDTIYARTGPNCKIFALAPGATWTLIRSDPTNDCSLMRAQEGQLLVALQVGTTYSVAKWNGSTWNQLFTTTTQVNNLAIKDAVIYVATSSDTLAWNGSIQLDAVVTVAQIIPLAEGLFGGGGGNSVAFKFNSATLWEGVQPPIGGDLITDGTNMYIVGNGIYVYSGVSYATRFIPANDVIDLTLFTDNTVGLTSFALGIVPLPNNFASWTYLGIGINDPVAIAGSSGNDFYISDGTTIYHYLNVTLPGTVVTNPATGIRDLWVPPSGTPKLYAVGDDQLAMSLTGTTWTPITPPAATMGCMLTELAGDASSVYATGTCGTQGVIWQLAGTSWTEIRRTAFPLTSVTVDLAGNVYAVGLSGGTHLIAGVWTDDPAAVGVSVAATAPDDVWVAGGPGSVIHWDGLSWSRLNVIGPNKPRVVATPHAVTISGVSNPVLLR